MKGAVVMTSIAAPNAVMRRIAQDCAERAMPFIVIGDTKSPAVFELDGCDYYAVEAQVASGLSFAAACPTRHYARKNIGCLLALRTGCDFIVETDDDNMPSPAFYEPLPRHAAYDSVAAPGWLNVYALYDDRSIWPRGLPLDEIAKPVPAVEPATLVDAPIQQGLADENPDVVGGDELALVDAWIADLGTAGWS